MRIRISTMYIIPMARSGGKYKSIKSEFIRKKIRGARYRDASYREYIGSLIWLERLLVNGVRCMGDSMAYKSLQNEYSKEYAAIYRELYPKRHEKKLQREKREQIEAERERRKERAELKRSDAQDLRDWVEIGGKQ